MCVYTFEKSSIPYSCFYFYNFDTFMYGIGSMISVECITEIPFTSQKLKSTFNMNEKANAFTASYCLEYFEVHLI